MTGVADSASFQSKLSPGGLFTIFGQNLSLGTAGATTLPLAPNLNGTTILVNGVAAPILWTSPSVVNAQLPYEIGIGSANLIVQVANAATIASESVNVSPIAPGVFTLNDNGITIGAIRTGGRIAC